MRVESGELEQSALIRRAQAGDEQALTELLVEHGPVVRRQLAIPDRWRSVLDVDEIMQAAYYKAFLGIAAFEPRSPEKTRFGQMIFRGGLVLTGDHPRFGGLSGLWRSPDGRDLVAVTDNGFWLTGKPAYRNGRLAGIGDGVG